jgi:hypothetical protein
MAFGEQPLQRHELDAGMRLRRPVPRQHLHAAAGRDPRDFRGDAAKADQAERLAGQFDAVARAASCRRASRGPSRAKPLAADHISAMAHSATAVSP